jgi:hypothetical protein
VHLLDTEEEKHQDEESLYVWCDGRWCQSASVAQIPL